MDQTSLSQAGTPDATADDRVQLTPVVISESVSPLVQGQRLPPMYRITMLRGHFYLEQRVGANAWKALATTRDWMAAHQGLHARAKQVRARAATPPKPQ